LTLQILHQDWVKVLHNKSKVLHDSHIYRLPP